MTTRKTGTIVQEEGKYFITIGRIRQELPLNMIPESRIAPLVGKKVEVELSEPIQQINGIFDVGPIKRLRWICYVPALSLHNPILDDLFVQHERTLQIAGRLLEEKIITPEVYAKLTGSVISAER